MWFRIINTEPVFTLLTQTSISQYQTNLEGGEEGDLASVQKKKKSGQVIYKRNVYARHVKHYAHGIGVERG